MRFLFGETEVHTHTESSELYIFLTSVQNGAKLCIALYKHELVNHHCAGRSFQSIPLPISIVLCR